MARKIGWTEDDGKNVLIFVGELIKLAEQPSQPDLYAVWVGDNLWVSGDRLTTKRGQERVEEDLGTTKGALLELLKQANQRLLLPSQRPDNDDNQIAEILDVLECLEQIGLLTEDGKLKTQGYRRFRLALLGSNRRQANLDYVAEQWRQVATQRLSPSTLGKIIPKLESPPEINWSAICREQNAKLRKSPTEEGFEPEIFVPLGLMERKQQQRRPLNQEMGMDQVYGVEEKAEVTRKFEHQEFLTYIGLGGKEAENAKNVAIIGEPGAGKTTLLADLAQVIDKHQELAIAISLGSFGAWQCLEPKRNLKDYLEQKWLEDALPDKNLSEADRVALGDRIRQGGVWLLLDGLDEMQASSPVEALTRIEQELRSGYLQKARVVLTCRVNVWDANLSNPLREFETYKTLDFVEGQRDDFIGQWFTKKGNLALGEGLIAKLKESGRERICELVKNPLRLVLLCYIWTQQAGELPETKAQFYQRYLSYFYEWKKEVRDLTQDDELQESLHQALAKLALAGIESDSRYRLPRKLARREMGQELFNLAVALGWLNIVDREQGTDEAVYAFFHPTFQEFFAACGVTDWDFFLPRNHVDRPVQGKVYRIFEAKWKEVILLWLGREDVKEAEKEAFIQALVEFKDSLRDFYGYRAFYLAAAGISEFKHCFFADEIVNRIIRWGYGYWNRETEKWTTFFTPIEKSARKILPETDRTRAITALINILSYINEDIISFGIYYSVFENLGKIGQDNKKVIAALIKLLSFPDVNIRWQAADSLEKIGQGNQEAITALTKLLCSFNIEEDTRSKAAETLVQIDPGNPEAIAVLINLLSSSYWTIRHQAIESLGKIGHGNKEVIAELIKLLSSPDTDKDTRKKVAESLKKAGQGNKEVIAELIKLLSSSNKYICCLASEILGEINFGNQEAIAVLINLLSSSDWIIRNRAIEGLGKIGHGNKKAISILNNILDEDILLRKELAAESLGKIAQGNKEAISTLIKFLSSLDENTCRSRAVPRAIESLGKIAQGSKEAIATLIKLILPKYSFWEAVDSLEKIAQGSKEAITLLTEVLSSPDRVTRLLATMSLGRIDPGNQEAITVFIKDIFSSNKNQSYLAAYDLEKILQKEQMSGVVTALKDCVSDETYQNNFDQFKNCYQILWKCAQTLSYPG